MNSVANELRRRSSATRGVALLLVLSLLLSLGFDVRHHAAHAGHLSAGISSVMMKAPAHVTTAAETADQTTVTTAAVEMHRAMHETPDDNRCSDCCVTCCFFMLASDVSHVSDFRRASEPLAPANADLLTGLLSPSLYRPPISTL